MAKDRERSAGTDSTDNSQSQNGEGQGTSAGTDSTDSSQAQRGEVQGPPAASDSTGSSQAQSGEVQGPPAAEGTTEGGDYAEEAVTKPVNGTAATSFKEEIPGIKVRLSGSGSQQYLQ